MNRVFGGKALAELVETQENDKAKNQQSYEAEQLLAKLFLHGILRHPDRTGATGRLEGFALSTAIHNINLLDVRVKPEGAAVPIYVNSLRYFCHSERSEESPTCQDYLSFSGILRRTTPQNDKLSKSERSLG
jgi:hypothetical protein